MNPLTRLISWSIRLYQVVISPVLPPACRFHPTCSQYAVRALQEHGLLKGMMLSVRRVLRCHPWNEGGVDPVPPSKKRGS